MHYYRLKREEEVLSFKWIIRHEETSSETTIARYGVGFKRKETCAFLCILHARKNRA